MRFCYACASCLWYEYSSVATKLCGKMNLRFVSNAALCMYDCHSWTSCLYKAILTSYTVELLLVLKNQLALVMEGLHKRI